MEALFLKLVNMSITASWLVLAILAIRLVFRKIPKRILCLLWGLVAIRLVCPFSLESNLSLIPNPEPIPQEIIYAAQPEIHSGIAVVDEMVNPVLVSTLSPEPAASVNPTQIVSFVFSQIWLVGMILMLLYALFSYFVLKRKICTAITLSKRIKQSEFVDTPFVLGILKPVIYLPSGIHQEDIAYVLAHEKAHIARKDHWWKPLGFLLLSIYWFNPVLWLAYVLLCRDIEAACDENVIQNMDRKQRRAYSTALLNCSIHHRPLAACPLAFGETGVKARIKHVMYYKRPAFWIVLLAAIVAILVAVCFLTNPKQDLEELTLIEGPCSVGIGELEFTLPQGFTIAMRESKVQAVGDLFEHEHIIRKNGEIIGGVYKLQRSDLGWATYFDYVQNLNIPENVPEERLLMSVEGSLDMNLVAAYGNQGITERLHHLYQGKLLVYDLWFNTEILGEEEINQITKTVYLSTEEENTDNKTQNFKLANMPYQILGLPEGFICEQDSDNCFIFRDGNTIVGGIIGYPIPEGVYDPYDKSFFWLEQVGIPDFEDSSLCYMGGITSGNNGWVAEFASDVPEGVEQTVYRRHHFEPIGDMVYDIWFDMLSIEFHTSQDICKSIKKLSVSGNQPAASEPTEEEIAYEKCHSVMSAVENESCHIVATRINEGTRQYTDYEQSFFYHEGNYLHTLRFLDGTPYRYALLIADDVFYDNTGYQDNTDEIIWTNRDPVDPPVPWLGNHVWVKNYVAYMDTVEDASGNIVYMWRYDKKYEDSEDYADHYFVNFVFDPEGKFVEVSIQVNLFMDNAFTITESIVSLDPEVVNAEIQKEYLRATN